MFYVDAASNSLLLVINTADIRLSDNNNQYPFIFRGVLEHQVKQTMSESPSKKLRRQSASSHARLSYMSPDNQKQRKHQQKMKHDSDQRRLHRFDLDMPLDNEQDNEMSAVCSTIDKKCSDELDKLFAEDEHGVGVRLREAWNSDRRSELHDFQHFTIAIKVDTAVLYWCFSA